MILRRFTSGPSADELAEVREQLGKVRRRLRNVRAKKDEAVADNERLRGRLDRVEGELAVLRTFTLDVFPGIEVSADVRRVIDSAIEERLTYLNVEQLSALASCVLDAERAGRPGAILEAGTALGGSAIALAAAKDPARPMYVYDTFGMIPPPSERDTERERERYEDIAAGTSRGIRGDTYYGYRDDLVGEVTDSFKRLGVPIERHHVQLVQGLFEDTIDLDEPVAVAHIDGDWYDSTMTCLTRIAPLVVPGGRLVIDDYHQWSGCKAAVDEYFADRPEFRVEHRAKVHVVRL